MLRLLILTNTKRPVLTTPIPQREYDISRIPQDVLHADSRQSPNTTTPALASIPSSAPLRAHLYPMITALPESHLAEPLTLLPELSSISEYTSEILACSATLIHVVLLLRSVVSTLHQFSLPYFGATRSKFFLRIRDTWLTSRKRRPRENRPNESSNRAHSQHSPHHSHLSSSPSH